MELIYLDHSATTPLCDDAIKTLDYCNKKHFGNPSSVHSSGQTAKKLLEQSRTVIASLINASASEVIFTSGGSESNNLAIKGIALNSKKKHIITTSVEHLSVLNTCNYLESLGFRISYLPVNSDGMIDLSELQETIGQDTALVSIQHVNNETGVIQNIEEIGKIVRSSGSLFHVDAVQSVGKLKVDVSLCNIDLLSASAHKINGPKGVGLLYINQRIKDMTPLIHGGAQEKNRRAGTINLPSICAFAAAVRLSHINNENDKLKTMQLRDFLEKETIKLFPSAIIHGISSPRIYSISSMAFPGHENDSLLIGLDIQGICASAGSACSSGSIQPSHVLTAMNVEKHLINSTLRFSFGYGNTLDQIKTTLSVLSTFLSKS